MLGPYLNYYKINIYNQIGSSGDTLYRVDMNYKKAATNRR